MKYKLAIIRNCGDCNCASGDVLKEEPFCILTKKLIVDTHSVPEWCPLEDANIDTLSTKKKEG
jgi:hypothetical protein